MLTLGSLFDGAGTFPFAAQQCGVKALWASEIEPFPVEVTKKRLPEMKHLGDITKVDGAEIEPVDIVTFGSPCQDLSVAGKRAGLDGERSGLFIQNGYTIGLTIDRIDPTGDYEPNNCRWVTMSEQQSNRRTTHFIEYQGERHTLTEWSKLLHIPRGTLSNRLNMLGWGVEKALGGDEA